MCYVQRHKHCSDTKRMFASNNERWKLATHRVDAGLDIRTPPPPRPRDAPPLPPRDEVQNHAWLSAQVSGQLMG